MKKDIRSLEEIPFGKELIATGKVNRIVWFCRVPGRFVKNDGAIVFVDVHGVAVPVDEEIDVAAILTE